MRSLMLHRRKLKRLLITAIGSLLAACTSVKEPVYCHEWRGADLASQKQAIEDLPDNSPLHAVIRDYERVCISLKS